MGKSQRSVSIQKLRELCWHEGFIYSFAELVRRHVFTAMDLDQPSAVALNKFKSSEYLNQAEMLLLLHMINEVDTSRPTLKPKDSEITQMADQAEVLLDELHVTFWDEMVPISSYLQQDEQQLLDMLNSASLREASSYSEEPGYPFQYLDLAKIRYADDDSWMLHHLGFTSQQMVFYIRQLLFIIQARLSSLSSLDQPLLEAFNVSNVLESETDADLRQIFEKVIDFFTLPDMPLTQIRDFGDYNELVAKPIVQLGDRKYLFLPNVLSTAVYDAPFYAFLNDSSYRDLSFQHRGDFTEDFVYHRLAAVLGEDCTYRNVNLWRGKNKTGEIDVMGIVADRLILVQCKSKKMTMKAREGDQTAAKTDFKKAIQDAYEQNIRCARDLQDPNVEMRNDAGDGLLLPRSYSDIYPICVDSEIYPSLNMQAHEYLAADASADIVENIREQIVTDIFFIDVLTELLNTPLLIIDYIAQRCQYGQRFTVQSEINALGCYLSEAMYFDDKVDNIIIDSDMGRDVDMAMTVRRLLGIPGQRIPQGLLTKLNRDDPYSSFVQQLSSPHRNEELQLGMSLLHYPEERVLKQFNVVTEQIRSRCTANRPTHSVSVEFSGTGGFSLVSTLEAVTAKATLSAVDTIRRNQKKRGGEWFTIVFNSRSLRILDIEHCGSKILKNVPTESTFS